MLFLCCYIFIFYWKRRRKKKKKFICLFYNMEGDMKLPMILVLVKFLKSACYNLKKKQFLPQHVCVYFIVTYFLQVTPKIKHLWMYCQSNILIFTTNNEVRRSLQQTLRHSTVFLLHCTSQACIHPLTPQTNHPLPRYCC